MIDDFRYQVKYVLTSKNSRAMINMLRSTQCFDHRFGSHQIRRVIHTHGEAWDWSIITRSFTIHGHECVCYHAGINTPTQKETVIHIGHHPFRHGRPESLTDGFIRWSFGWFKVFIHHPCGSMVSDGPSFRRPIVPRGDGFRRGRIHMTRQRFQFGGKDMHFPISRGGSVEWFDSHWIADTKHRH